MKGDARPALRRVFERQRRDGEGALAVRRPAPGLVRPGAARVDGDFVRDHERRIEADAELPDEGGGFLARVFGRELVQEGLGAGAGDGAKPARQVVAGHADAIVREGQGLGVRIDRDFDRERRAVLDQFRLGDRFVAQLLAGVGGVGDELADENLPVGIDRMDHEMQQARNVGLEALGAGGFAGRGLGVGGQGKPLEECWNVEFRPKRRGEPHIGPRTRRCKPEIRRLRGRILSAGPSGRARGSSSDWCAVTSASHLDRRRLHGGNRREAALRLAGHSSSSLDRRLKRAIPELSLRLDATRATVSAR